MMFLLYNALFYHSLFQFYLSYFPAPLPSGTVLEGRCPYPVQGTVGAGSAQRYRTVWARDQLSLSLFIT